MASPSHQYYAQIYADNMNLSEHNEDALRDVQNTKVNITEDESIIPLDAWVGSAETRREIIKHFISWKVQQLRPRFQVVHGNGHVLIYGPTGTGKTALAYTIAKHVGATLYVVPLHATSETRVGQVDKFLARLFADAYHNSPSIILVDEIERIFAHGKDGATGFEWRRARVFNYHCKKVMDMQSQVVVVGTTCYPWRVATYQGFGRSLTRKIYVPLPSELQRCHLIELYLRGRGIPIDHALNHNNISELARQTAGCSGADIQEILYNCVQEKLVEMSQATVFRAVHESNSPGAVKYIPQEAGQQGVYITSNRQRQLLNATYGPVTMETVSRVLSEYEPRVTHAEAKCYTDYENSVLDPEDLKRSGLE